MKQEVVRAWWSVQKQCSAAVCDELERIISQLFESDPSWAGALAQKARATLRPRLSGEPAPHSLEHMQWMTLAGIRPHELPDPGTSSSVCRGEGSMDSAWRHSCVVAPPSDVSHTEEPEQACGFLSGSPTCMEEGATDLGHDDSVPVFAQPASSPCALRAVPELAASPSVPLALPAVEDDHQGQQECELVDWYNSLFDT